MIVSPKCELRIGKEKVENQNADNRRNQTVNPMSCNDRGHKNAENIYRDDICLCKLQLPEQHSYTAWQN